MPKILSPAEQHARALRKRTESFHCNPRRLASLVKQHHIRKAAIAKSEKRGRRVRASAARREVLRLAEKRAANFVKPVFDE